MSKGIELVDILPFKDYRGSLKKIFKKSIMGENLNIEEAYVLYSCKGAIRGNHYHEINTEYFCVLKGTVKFAIKDLKNNYIDEIELNGKDNIVIVIPPLTAHAFINENDEESIVLVLATKEYDAMDNDTYKLDILA